MHGHYSDGNLCGFFPCIIAHYLAIECQSGSSQMKQGFLRDSSEELTKAGPSVGLEVITKATLATVTQSLIVRGVTENTDLLASPVSATGVPHFKGKKTNNYVVVLLFAWCWFYWVSKGVIWEQKHHRNNYWFDYFIFALSVCVLPIPNTLYGSVHTQAPRLFKYAYLMFSILRKNRCFSFHNQ